MKKMWGTRVLAMLLVLALTAGLVPAALAANSEAAVAFKQVPNDTLDTLIPWKCISKVFLSLKP